MSNLKPTHIAANCTSFFHSTHILPVHLQRFCHCENLRSHRRAGNIAISRSLSNWRNVEGKILIERNDVNQQCDRYTTNISAVVCYVATFYTHLFMNYTRLTAGWRARVQAPVRSALHRRFSSTLTEHPNNGT